MSKSRKEIHTEKLEGVQNSLKNLNQEISNLADAGLDENSKTAIDSGNTAIKTTTSLTKTMLDSFDKFLADAATAFKDTDEKLQPGEDQLGSLLFNVQSNEDSSFRVFKVPEAKSITLDDLNEVISSL